MTLFATMDAQDDALDMGPEIKNYGRWHMPTEARGFAILEAPSAAVVNNHLYNWTSKGNIKVTPVCDDNTAREIILKSTPAYQVDYNSTNDEPVPGETLFAIEWNFHESKRLEGFQAFANMTREQDKADQGNTRLLGRWHDLGTGCGFAIAGATCGADAYAAVCNWVGICDIVIKPVLTDKQARGVMQSKPGFTEKAKALLDSMGKTYVSRQIPVPALHESFKPSGNHLFGVKYQILNHSREACYTFFATMDEQDDARDLGVNIKKHGRWHIMSECRGYAVLEAPNAAILFQHLQNWSTMADIEVIPITDDNTARGIILKATPSYTVDYYSHSDEEPLEGETLYAIRYQFHRSKRLDGFQTFANMTQEQDLADAGQNRILGRWHNLGSGTGLGICASKSAEDVQAWVSNWAGLCDCEINTVLTDRQARELVQRKPDFASKAKEIMKTMGMEQHIPLEGNLPVA